MKPPRLLSERVHRLRRWLIPAALLAFVPKCALCVLAYVGVGAAFGFSGPEICGAATGPDPWTGLLPTFGLAASTIGLVAWGRHRRTV